jgi:hypothetical protein
VPTGGNAVPVSARLLVPLGELGGFGLPVSAGGGDDGAGVVEPGQFSAFGGIEIAAWLARSGVLLRNRGCGLCAHGWSRSCS